MKDDLNNTLPENPTKSDLAKVLEEVKNGNAQNAETILAGITKLAEAMLESRKPYKSPSQMAAEEQGRQDLRDQINKNRKQKEWLKKNCPHRRPYDNTLNISWHQHSNGIIMGVCGECMSQFDARKAEDLALLRQDPQAHSRMARAGEHAHR